VSTSPGADGSPRLQRGRLFWRLFVRAGMLALAFDVDRAGRAQRVRVLSDTTRVALDHEVERKRFVLRLRKTVAAWKFAKQRGVSRVTLPLVFERG